MVETDFDGAKKFLDGIRKGDVVTYNFFLKRIPKNGTRTCKQEVGKRIILNRK
ncbi:MAG: hypothetical protein ACI9P9_000739 [Patescibacteria group bacterium]|jgi:hypothetical protein